MTRYEEEVLGGGLPGAADRIEPAPDGLERIRARLSKPRLLAVAGLMVCWTGVAQLALLRMEPAVASLFERLGAWLRLVIKSLGAGVERVRPAVERLRPAAERLLAAVKLLRPASGMSRHEKVRSAIALAAAAVIGTPGGFALSAGGPHQVIAGAFSPLAESQPHHAPSRGPTP